MTDLEGARADTERALALDPEGPDTLRRAGVLYLFTGRFEDAIRTMRRAADADPLLPRNWTWLSRAYWAAGRIGEANAALDRALALEPNAWYVALKGHLLLEEGRPQEALPWFERSNPGTRHRGLAMALHDLGRQAEAQAVMDEMRRLYPQGALGRGQVYAWWGDREKAFEELAIAAEERRYSRIEMLTNPILRSLHGDPRWTALLRRAGFP
jgi:tetratricopeptide (TPR) repeat protein